MIPIRDPALLCPVDVLIHPTRGGALVDRVVHDGVWVEFAERLDRSRALVPLREVTESWRLAAPGGLFEASVLHHDEAMGRVSDRPAEALAQLCDELDAPIYPELAATWLVSRGLLAPGRAIAWWSEALARLDSQPRLKLLEDGSVSLLNEPEPSLHNGPSGEVKDLRLAGARARHKHLTQLDPSQRASLLAAAVEKGQVDLVLVLLRWSLHQPPPDGLDRLAASGNRDLLLRCAAIYPSLVAPELLSALRSPAPSPMVEDVLRRLPLLQRAALQMELLLHSLDDLDLLDTVEGMIEESSSIADLIRLVDPPAGGQPFCEPEERRRWTAVRKWMAGHSSDSTMEMPSLLPNPLLRDMDRLHAREVFPISIALARALTLRHAQGRYGGLDGARVHRTDLRVELGAPEPGHPRQDVQEAMTLVLGLAVGLGHKSITVSSTQLLAHAAGLAPLLAADWLAVCAEAVGTIDHPRSVADGLALWAALERAQATARVRETCPERGSVDLELGYDTHIGAAKARLGQTNQDAIFFHTHRDLSVLVVADGISTCTAGSGNLASAILIQTVASAWESQSETLARNDEAELFAFMRQVMDDANRAICDAALRIADGDLEQHIPMGTTVVMAMTRRGRALIASLGDSRAYLVGASGMAQLTGDGNLRGDWLKGLVIGSRTDVDGEAAALTAYLGHFDHSGSPEAIPPQEHSITLLPGETLMLCSDGLTDFAASEPAELADLVLRTLREQSSASASARCLVSFANAGGGGDNITVLLAHLLA